MPPCCDLGTVAFRASSPPRSYPLWHSPPCAGAARARFPSIVSGPSRCVCRALAVGPRPGLDWVPRLAQRDQRQNLSGSVASSLRFYSLKPPPCRQPCPPVRHLKGVVDGLPAPSLRVRSAASLAAILSTSRMTAAFAGDHSLSGCGGGDGSRRARPALTASAAAMKCLRVRCRRADVEVRVLGLRWQVCAGHLPDGCIALTQWSFPSPFGA